jgi:hypothetical protein
MKNIMNYKINALLGFFLLLNYYSHAQKQDSSERLNSVLSKRKAKELKSEDVDNKLKYLNEKTQNRLHSKDSVYFYIDSVRIDYDKYVIGTQSITSLDVIQDKTYTHNGGKIFISLRKGTIFKSLNGIVKEHNKNEHRLITSYIIDEKTNVDSVGVKIDTSCIKKAEMIKDSLGKYAFVITTTDFEKRKSYQKRNKGDGPLLIIR